MLAQLNAPLLPYDPSSVIFRVAEDGGAKMPPGVVNIETDITRYDEREGMG